MAAIIRRIIQSSKAPAAIGPYSQAVVVDRTMYIAGQVGLDPATGQLVDGGVLAQTKQALVNMGEILKAAGCDYKNGPIYIQGLAVKFFGLESRLLFHHFGVVKTTVLLTDMNDFAGVNDVYKQFFPNNCPARAAYQVVALPKNGLVEIEAVAVVGPITEASE